MNGRFSRTYYSAPGTMWLRDAACTLVIGPDRGSVCRLSATEAAAWDLLVLGYSFDRLVHTLSLLMDDSEEAACEAFMSMLAGWADAGLVCTEDATWPTS